ncbi:MAG: hypothetical protein ACK44C_11065 [Polaromonas sp.]
MLDTVNKNWQYSRSFVYCWNFASEKQGPRTKTHAVVSEQTSGSSEILVKHHGQATAAVLVNAQADARGCQIATGSSDGGNAAG